MASNKNIVLGVTGSIASYKACYLARVLQERGFNVRVVMTPSATEFVAPLTFKSLTGSNVVVHWEDAETNAISHVELADWADCIVIAPATASTIAKYANGIADNELLAMLLVSRAPVLIAPAMNSNMLSHPATVSNITTLAERGCTIIDSECGDLACGWNGKGRLAEEEIIYEHVVRAITPATLAGKKVVVTAGPTREMIDPVRFISNCSSGKMGIAIALEAFYRGAEVTLIHGPMQESVPNIIKVEGVTSAADMHEKVKNIVFDQQTPADILVMAAAVADISPENIEDEKIKEKEDWTEIKLKPNVDILADVSKIREDSPSPLLVGFAVETCDQEEIIGLVKEKIERKNVDIIVGNLAAEAFDQNTNHVWIVDKFGREEEIATTFKSRVASKIFDTILKAD